eukprot:ANDGO_08329.mRNA.1 LRR and IQ domain protein
MAKRVQLDSGSRVLQEYFLNPSQVWDKEDKCEVVILSSFGMSTFLKDSFIFRFSALKKLDISKNRLQSLPPAACWHFLGCLEVLFLHENYLSKFSDVFKLGALPKLQYLTCFENPIALHPDYRPKIVSALRSLRALDEHVISDAEASSDYASLDYRGHFSPLSSVYRILKPSERASVLFGDAALGGSGADQCFLMDVELKEVSQIFAKQNPSSKVQRSWKHLRQKMMKSRMEQVLKRSVLDIQRVFRGYKCRRENKPVMSDSKAVLLIQKLFRIRRAKRLAKSFKCANLPFSFYCAEEDMQLVVSLLDKSLRILGKHNVRQLTIGQASTNSSSSRDESADDERLENNEQDQQPLDREDPNFLDDHEFQSGFSSFGPLKSPIMLSNAADDRLDLAPPSLQSSFAALKLDHDHKKTVHYIVKSSYILSLRKSTSVSHKGIFQDTFSDGNFVCRRLLSIKPLREYLANCGLVMDRAAIIRYATTYLRPRYRFSSRRIAEFMQIIREEIENEQYREFLKEIQLPDSRLAGYFLSLVQEHNQSILSRIPGKPSLHDMTDANRLLVLYDVGMTNRVCNAVSVQSSWRGHVARQSMDPPLIDGILRNRGAMLLQAHIRGLLARVRTTMLLECVKIIRKFRNGQSIVLREEVDMEMWQWDHIHDHSVSCIPESNLQFGFSLSNWLLLRDNSMLPFWLRAWLPEAASGELVYDVSRSVRQTWWVARFRASRCLLEDDDGVRYVMYTFESMQEAVARALMFTIRTFLFHTSSGLPLLAVDEVPDSALVRRSQILFRRCIERRKRIRLALSRIPIQPNLKRQTSAGVIGKDAPEAERNPRSEKVSSLDLGKLLRDVRSGTGAPVSHRSSKVAASSTDRESLTSSRARDSNAVNTRLSAAAPSGFSVSQLTFADDDPSTSDMALSSDALEKSVDLLVQGREAPVVADMALRHTNDLRGRDLLCTDALYPSTDDAEQRNRAREHRLIEDQKRREVRERLRFLDTGPSSAFRDAPTIPPHLINSDERACEMKDRVSVRRISMKSAVQTSRQNANARKAQLGSQVRLESGAMRKTVASLQRVSKPRSIPCASRASDRKTSPVSSSLGSAAVVQFAQMRSLLSRHAISSEFAQIKEAQVTANREKVAAIRSSLSSRSGSRPTRSDVEQVSNEPSTQPSSARSVWVAASSISDVDVDADLPVHFHVSEETECLRIRERDRVPSLSSSVSPDEIPRRGSIALLSVQVPLFDGPPSLHSIKGSVSPPSLPVIPRQNSLKVTRPSSSNSRSLRHDSSDPLPDLLLFGNSKTGSDRPSVSPFI